jgi:hypothetical protein
MDPDSPGSLLEFSVKLRVIYEYEAHSDCRLLDPSSLFFLAM